MPEFVYKAQSPAGKLIKGNMDGSDEMFVIQCLKRNGYYPVEVNKAYASKDIKIAIFSKVGMRDIAIFCRQFATMISAGLTVVSSLDILYRQTGKKKLKQVIKDTLEQVQKGKILSESMAEHKEFPQLLINMVEAGEASGQLDRILDRMAVYYEKENNLRQKVKSAMSYPSVVSAVAICVVAFLVTKVLPTFSSMYSSFNAQLPMPTRLLLAVSYGISHYWMIILISIVSLAYFVRWYSSSKKGRYVYHKFKLEIPVFGKIEKKIITARFARTLSILLSSGIPVIQAMDIVGKAITNAVIENGIEKCKECMKRGIGVAKPLLTVGIFPEMLIQMINVGEESGSLDSMLQKTADYYDEEVDACVSSLTTLIEPFIIVLLAIVVGFIIIGMVIPMFDMYKYMSV